MQIPDTRKNAKIFSHKENKADFAGRNSKVVRTDKILILILKLIFQNKVYSGVRFAEGTPNLPEGRDGKPRVSHQTAGLPIRAARLFGWVMDTGWNVVYRRTLRRMGGIMKRCTIGSIWILAISLTLYCGSASALTMEWKNPGSLVGVFSDNDSP